MLFVNTIAMAQQKNIRPDFETGNLKICMLRDGDIYLNISLLSGIEHNKAYQLAGNKDTAFTPVNAYLVQTPHHLVLVDAGMGGNLLAQLKQAGVEPADIDMILITHFHFDHIGGLTTPDGKRVFPNAIVKVSQPENDYWMHDSMQIPENQRARAKSIQAVFKPYRQNNAYSTFISGNDLGDGIVPVTAIGHTPGHAVYTFTSNGNSIWCIGDLIHFGEIQFANPLASLKFDSDSSRAIASRLEFFKQAAQQHVIVAGAHLPQMVQIEQLGDVFKAAPVKTLR
jgi:glyoxylase-like metal-dependent hydrolase (beta-lactamase superfamily II)